MTDYRLYRLDPRGKIESAQWLTAEDDADAVAQARSLDGVALCELWESNRLVAQLRVRAIA